MFFQRKACANKSLFSNSKANNNKLRWPRNIKRSPKQSLGDFFSIFPSDNNGNNFRSYKGRDKSVKLRTKSEMKRNVEISLKCAIFQKGNLRGAKKKLILASVSVFFLAQFFLFDKSIFLMQGCFKLFDLTGAKNDSYPMRGLSP